MPVFDDKEFTPTIYTAEQIKTLLEYAEREKSKACLFLFLGMFTGCRKDELLALTWDNVNFDDGVIHICRNRTGSKKEVLDVSNISKDKKRYKNDPTTSKSYDYVES